MPRPATSKRDRSMREAAIRRQKCADIEWAQLNGELHHRFAGHLVVVHKKQLLLSGSDRRDLLKRAASPEHPRDELVVVAIPTDN
jgi:hypothetical protein